MSNMSLIERKQECRVCHKEKPLDEFRKDNFGSTIVIDTICLQWCGAGRQSLEELMARPHAGGRPEIDLPLERIKELRESGLGYKSIASILKSMGFDVSHTTVKRRLDESS